MEIREPSTLARLPRSKVDNGRAFFRQVYSISNGLKRKRQELCTAVDGDSINIYEAQHGRNISSYALPPDSNLLCPPCSLRSNSSTDGKIRSTYYVIKRRNETKLSMFQDEPSGSTRQPTSRSILLSNEAAAVVLLEVLCLSVGYQILVAREDGQFEIYNAELSAQLGHGKLNGCPEQARLVTLQWLSPNQASKSVLKARPDILALSDSSCSYIIGVFAVSEGQPAGASRGVEFGIWQLPKSAPHYLVDSRLDPLLHHRFPIASPLISGEKDPVFFTSNDTRLIIRTQSKTYVFNIALTNPQKIQEMSPVATDQISSIFISDALTLLSTSATIQLFNTQYNTLQSRLDLNQIGSKRKRGTSSWGPITLLVFLPTLNRIIANRRDQLIAIDLQVLGGEDFSRTAEESSLLISNIGRGAASHERLRLSHQPAECLAGCYGGQNEQIKDWHNTVTRLEQYITEKAYDQFERTAVENLVGHPEQPMKNSHRLINYKVDYIISKLFETESTAEDGSIHAGRGLKLAIPAPNLLKLLAVKGYFSNERIGKVLKGYAKANLELIAYGDVSRILIDSDQSLGLLNTYLEEAPRIAYQELCFITLLLLQRALARTSGASSTAIQGSQLQLSGVADPSIVPPASAATTGLIPDNITQCLCKAIERLSDTAQGVLSTFLRQSFTQAEIIALVQFLRQQLFRIGYTRSVQAQPFASPPPSEDESAIDGGQSQIGRTELTLGAIATTLSSCVDAVGPIGVLSLGDEEEFVHTLIPELSSEIARATESVQDAVFLEGMLRETLRFVESTSHKEPNLVDTDGGIENQQPKSGAIVTLYSESATNGSLDQHYGVLPLGLRAEGKINAMKVRKGDGKVSKRSVREMGMLQDRIRGSYALERLVL